MELKNLINNMNNENISLDQQEIKIENIIVDRKYNILNSYLKEKNIITTNDLKRLTTSDYNKLKMNVPDLEGVGEEKTSLFIKILDGLRRENHTYSEPITSSSYPIIENLGKLTISTNWSIEVNNIKYNKYDEYVDIRQVKNDGTRGKGISIKRQDFNSFKKIINSISLDNEDDTKVEEEICNSNSEICNIDITSSFITTPDVESHSLKERILENEDILYEEFKDDFGLAIKYFKNKIENLREDGDIVRFLENPSILGIKNDQYDKTHNKGLKTAIDIKNSYDKSNLKYTTISDLKKNEKINSMVICSIVNNFNVMLGMYYDETNKSLILKCQIKHGPYEDRWIDTNKKLYYCLQNETPENFAKLSFSKSTNRICKNIIFGYDLDTKVYLFYRYNKNDDYTYAGEVKLEKFVDGNKAIIITIPEEKDYISND